MMFGKTDHPEVAKRLNRLKRIFPSNSRNRFRRFATHYAPDTVLCTHYLPLAMLGRMRALPGQRGRKGTYPFLLCIVTDFQTLALQMDACLFLHSVAAYEINNHMLSCS